LQSHDYSNKKYYISFYLNALFSIDLKENQQSINTKFKRFAKSFFQKKKNQLKQLSDSFIMIYQ